MIVPRARKLPSSQRTPIGVATPRPLQGRVARAEGRGEEGDRPVHAEARDSGVTNTETGRAR